jgi:4-amino-4-deoxy-L-arabinose transferase-like glycosyltransferase
MNTNPGIWSSGRRAVIAGVLAVIVLMVTAGQIGVTWDEPAYMAASESYNGWLNRLVFGPHGVLNQGVVDAAWSVNNEHPPIDKELSGIVWAVARNVFDDLLARRLGNILLLGLTVAFLYHMIADELGDLAAVGTVAALLTLPRFFFHAHLAALDVPAACMVVIVTYVFWRTKESARIRYTILLGLVAGLALATKINAAFILPTLFLWALIFRRKFYLLIRLALAAAIAVPVFIGLWPWLYYDTVNRIKEYLGFQTVSHWEIAQYYLKKVLMPPPWHFPFVMTWAVVPLGTTLLYAVGILRGVLRRRDRAFCFLLLLNALVPLVLLAAGQTMVYDDERLFMPAFPFLAALAGAGFAWLANWLKNALLRTRIPAIATALTAAAGILFLASPVYGIVTYYPHLLSYYSESVGALAGAADRGLETTYWCESYRAAVEFINANAQPGDTVWAEPWSSDVLVYYQLHGILRDDVQIAVASGDETATVFHTDPPFSKIVQSYSQATFVVIQYRQTWLLDPDGNPRDVMQWMSGLEPAFRVERGGIPIVDVYWKQ